MAISVGKYNMISESTSEFSLPKLVTHVPNPSDKDYKRGYIVRYFIQKINDSQSSIYEISKDSYSSFSSNPFYNVISLDWRVTGSSEQIKESNFQSVKIASKSMKSIMMYLPNYLQFGKPY